MGAGTPSPSNQCRRSVEWVERLFNTVPRPPSTWPEYPPRLPAGQILEAVWRSPPELHKLTQFREPVKWVRRMAPAKGAVTHGL